MGIKLKEWFNTLYDDTTQSYRMQHDGEVDVRAYYCIVTVSSLLNIIVDDYYTNIHYILSCQTYEGGFGGEPNSEAHGGYTYCALATLAILNSLKKIRNVKACRGWISRRQMSYEGGFSGRANKLVDGCYSFWQGTSMAILNIYHHTNNTNKKLCMYAPTTATTTTTTNNIIKLNDSNNNTKGSLLYNQGKLQKYILL